MFNKTLTGIALLAMAASARREPRPWRGGVDEDRDGIIVKQAAYCYVGPDGASPYPENFFIGIGAAEGIDQDEITAWGYDLQVGDGVPETFDVDSTEYMILLELAED